MIMKNKELNYGISLIQLIITIIVIVILASATISILVNNNIITSSKEAVSEYNASQVKEKLMVLLSKAQEEKYNNVDFDLKDFLEKKEITFLNDDTLLYYDYMFKINLDTLKIDRIIEKEEKEESIVIVCNKEINSDYTKATINIDVTSDNVINKVVINGIESEAGYTSYSSSIEVNDNGNYTVMAYVGEKYNYNTVKVTEISEDMVITTADELKWFRDRVNKGATYIGKTIKLANDIKLNNEEKWTPIGAYTGSNLSDGSNKAFKGTFDGSGYEIDGLYIYNENQYDKCQGLFCLVIGGTVKNLGVGSNSTIKGSGNGTAALVGYLYNGAKVENCHNKAKVEGNNYVAGLVGLTSENCIIKNSYNEGLIIGDVGYIGGIVGTNQNNSQILTSYNSGYVTGLYNVGGIVGYNYNSQVDSSYNIGIVTSTGNLSQQACTGGIVGNNYYNSTVSNCYNAGDITSVYPEVGGIIGSNQYAKVSKNIFNAGTVKKDTITATEYLGPASDFIGTLIGRYGSYEGNVGNVSKENMKAWKEEDGTIKNNIGPNFKEDKQNKNNGLPILSWQ